MGVMPYQFEKGLFPTLLEAYFNDGLDDLAPTATLEQALALPGPTARLRAIWRFGSVARFLRDSQPEDTLEVTPENSFVLSHMFPAQPPPPPRPDFQRIVAERWLGMTVTDDGNQRKFVRNDPRDWQPDATIGRWTGYYGNVELIVAEAVQRLLEVSLGLDHLDPPTIHTTLSEAKALEDQLAERVTRVWPIYLFLTCPKPWFEVWITWQRHSRSYPQFRGQVTVILATPGHDRPVSPSPVDLVNDQREQPDGRPNPYYLHGREDLADGYGGKYVESIDPVTGDALPQPRTSGADPTTSGGPQGMWVVTHENHDSAILWSTFFEGLDFAKTSNFSPGVQKPEAWDLPPIASYRPSTIEERDDVRITPKSPGLTGYDRVVVVQPAGRDGGVTQP
jgi:hypothetical protein